MLHQALLVRRITSLPRGFTFLGRNPLRSFYSLPILISHSPWTEDPFSMPISEGRGTFRRLFTPQELNSRSNDWSFSSSHWFVPRSSFNAHEFQDFWRRIDNEEIREPQQGNTTARSNIARLLIPGAFAIQRLVSWDHYTTLHLARAPPIFREVFRSLKRHEATDEDISLNEDAAKRDRCTVCLGGFAKRDILAIGPCTHKFHDICVASWLVEKNTCPTCRIDWLRDIPSYT